MGGSMAKQGMAARFVDIAPYGFHLIAIHGWFRVRAHIAIDRVSRIVWTKLNLH